MRNAYYLRKKLGWSSVEATDKYYNEKNCLLNPKKLIAFERGNYELSELIMLPSLAELYGVTVEDLLKDDGVDWRDL